MNSTQPKTMKGKAGRRFQALMQSYEKMQVEEKIQLDLQAIDVDLGHLITQMNATEGAEKANCTAAVLTKMADQHRVMHQRSAR